MAVTDITEHRTTVDGVPHRWLARGDGPKVVLVHGIPTSPELWRHVLRRLDGARLLAWELVGFGRSWAAGADRDISVAAQADHLLAWMDALSIDRAVLVGHDLGGGVVQNVATRAPDRCAGIALANCIAYDNWPVAPARAVARSGDVVARLPRPILRVIFEAVLRGGHDSTRRTHHAARVHWQGYDHEHGGEVLVRQTRSLRTEDTLQIAPELPKLDVPAALAWGAADDSLPLDDARRLAEDLGGHLDAIEGARHFVPEDHPDRMVAAIERVLRA